MTNDPRVTRGAHRAYRHRQFTASEVTTIRVHREVWREAMRLAGGDRSRITVIHATRVEVR